MDGVTEKLAGAGVRARAGWAIVRMWGFTVNDLKSMGRVLIRGVTGLVY